MSIAARRSRWLATLLLVAVSGLIAACGSQASPTPVKEFVYGLTVVPSGIDPHINSSSELGIVLRSVYDTLVYEDDKGQFVPGLATKWEISPDGLTYTFLLRQDVTFHDGTPFNADAVKANFERVLDPANHSQKAVQLLGPVKDIQVHDPYTVSLILSEPFAPLMDGLSQPYLGIASPKALAAYDSQTYQFHQVGSGPYKFVEFIVNDRIVLEKNPAYKWAPAGVVTNPGVPAVDRITFHFYDDVSTRAAALESGDAQIMGELLPTDAQRMASAKTIQLQPVTVPGQPLQFEFNTSVVPTNSLEARQALIQATDRQAIAQTVFHGYSPIAYGPLSANTLYYDPSVQGRYSYDPAQAAALFNSTGWVDSDNDGWRDDKGKPIEVTLVVPPWGLIPDVVQLIQDQWQNNLKIHVHIRQVASFPMLGDAAKAGDYNGIALNFFGRDPSVLNSFYQSGGFLNWSHISDPDLDQMLKSGQQEMDPTKRAEIYAKIQQRIMDQAVILPIRDYVNLNAALPGVQGLHYDVQGFFPYLTDLGLGQ